MGLHTALVLATGVGDAFARARAWGAGAGAARGSGNPVDEHVALGGEELGVVDGAAAGLEGFAVYQRRIGPLGDQANSARNASRLAQRLREPPRAGKRMVVVALNLQEARARDRRRELPPNLDRNHAIAGAVYLRAPAP